MEPNFPFLADEIAEPRLDMNIKVAAFTVCEKSIDTHYALPVKAVFFQSKNFLWLFQYWAGRVYDLCVYYMTGTPEGSTESGFMEKPGIEPATPGLQGIALIHYTTGASG